MTDHKKSGGDLLEEPLLDSFEESTPTPFDQTVDYLATTKGETLELFHRSTPRVAEALQLSYNMVYRFKSRYIQGKGNQLMRLTVSREGTGRQELVDSLRAGSGVPDAFFESQGSNAGFSPE